MAKLCWEGQEKRLNGAKNSPSVYEQQKGMLRSVGFAALEAALLGKTKINIGGYVYERSTI